MLGLADLGLDAGAVAAAAGSRLRTMRRRIRGAGAEMLEAARSEIAQRIAEIVREQVALMSGVLVVAETRRGELRDVSLELITRRTRHRRGAGGPLTVAVVDAEPAAVHGGAQLSTASTR